MKAIPPPIDTPGIPPRTGNFKGLEDLISKFVLTYHDSESEWPNLIDIPTWDIEAFEELLIDRGMSIRSTLLESYIEHEINRIIKNHFKKSMDEKVKNLKCENTQQEIISISEIYSNYFDENSWELRFFTQYLENECGEKLEPPCTPVNWVKRLIGLQNTPSNQEYIKGLILSIRLKKERTDRIQELESIINSDQKKIDRVDLDLIDDATGIEFERILSVLFNKLGYSSVVETPASGDQGADLVLTKSGDRFVIQAKRWSNKVTNSAIQEVVAAKAHYKCNKAMVVTNNDFTNSAIELAHANGVELWNRNKLAEQLGKVSIYESELRE